MDESERRRGQPIPKPVLERQLNQMQLSSLRQLEGFGWSLAFVRRPLVEPIQAVVVDGMGRKHAVLEIDGTVKERPDIQVRH